VRRLRHRLAGCALVLLSAAALGACGGNKQNPADATAENNGEYVRLGSIDYQLQVSRELNRFSIEDHQYLTGLPAGTSGPGKNEIWYGVFLRAVNDTHQTSPVSTSFVIADTQENQYRPVALNTTLNQYAWTGMTLPPLGTEPQHDTTAFFGPTQGSLLLFKLPTSVYSNRPLTLFINPPSGTKGQAKIPLDL
jgi:hypothetical protein